MDKNQFVDRDTGTMLANRQLHLLQSTTDNNKMQFKLSNWKHHTM